MGRRHGAGTLSVLGMATLLALAAARADSAEPIVLGTVFDTSGGQAILDLPSSHGAALALRHVNEAGGVLGRPLAAAAVDGDGDLAGLRARTAALVATDPAVVALLGLSDTDNVLAAAPAAAARGRVFLTSGATSPGLPAQVPLLYLACFGDNVQAAAAAEWAFDALKARRALVLYDPSHAYTKLLHGYFADRFTGLGGTITETRTIDPAATPVTVAPPGDVDLVFLGVETADDAARAVPALRRAGYAGPILGGDGYDADSVWKDHPDVADVYFTTHAYLGDDSPDPKVRAFVDAYAAAYPGEPQSAFAALGYDAVGLLAEAIRNAGSAAPDAIARGLSAIEGYQGVTGTISYSGNSRIPRKSVTILRVAEGRQVLVGQRMPEAVPAP